MSANASFSTLINADLLSFPPSSLPGEDDQVNTFVDVVNVFTMTVFTLEIILKVIAEARRPDQ